MILLDFKIDEKALAEDLKEDILNEDEDFLLISYFFMPVRMKFNQYELFEYEGDPWCEMPLLYVASGLKAVEKAKQIGQKGFILIEGPGEFVFTMINERTDVVVTYSDGLKLIVTVVSYIKLFEAFKIFENRVREFIWERVPLINKHPYWGPWLRGEKD